MNLSPARLMVAVFEDFVCVKVTGRADFTLGLDLKKLVHELSLRGCRRFVFELRDCTMMDSTFLGTLAGLALERRESEGTRDNPLELFNPNPRIAETLENLGVVHLFKIIHCLETPAAQFEPLAETPAGDKAAVTSNCLKAHNTLIALNPENFHRFKEVTRFLSEDLQRMALAGKE